MKWLLFIGIIGIVYFIFKMYRGSIKQSAVQNAFLAKLTFSKLNEQEKKDVQDKTIEILVRGGMNNEYALEFFHGLSELYQFSIMAMAMAELNIQPCLPNETWHYVERPLEPINNLKHQIDVMKNHLIKYHHVEVNFD